MQASKPPQKNTFPSWAHWLSQDADGTWWVFEVEPLQFHKGWYENEVGRYQKVGKTPITDWKKSLIKLNETFAREYDERKKQRNFS